MTAAFRSAQASNNGAGGTSITMTKPTGMSTDDVMLASVTARGGTGTGIMPPAGAITLVDTGMSLIERIATDGDGMWVATGTYGYIAWSDDAGTTWHKVLVDDDEFKSHFTYVAYGAGHWVVVAQLNGANYEWIWSSTDGKSWTPNTHHQYGPQGYFVGYLDDKWVIGDMDGVVWVNTSGDPSTAWTSYQTDPTDSNNPIWHVAYNGTKWLISTYATPENLYCVYSSDIIESTTWAPVSMTGVGSPDSATGCAWGNGTWVAVGYDSSATTGWVRTNPNADASGTWTNQTPPFGTSEYASKVVFANGKFVLPVATDDTTHIDTVVDTVDGIKFRSLDISGGNWWYQSDAAYGGLENRWMFGGDAVDTGATTSLYVQEPEWTFLDRKNSTTVLGQALFFKRVLASEPASWSFPLSSSALASGAIVALSGARVTPPASVQIGGQANASSANVVAPAIGTWGALSGVDVGLFGTAYGSSFTPPGSYTEPSNSDSASTGTSSATTSEGCYRALTGVTDIAAITAVAANAAVNIGHRIFMADLNAFSLALSLASVEIDKGSNAEVAGDTEVTVGSAETVTMSATDLPTGVTVDFDPAEITAGNSTTLTIAVDQTATEGDNDVKIVGTAASWEATQKIKVKKKDAPVPVFVYPPSGAM